jgi:SulP family sulfate permease
MTTLLTDLKIPAKDWFKEMIAGLSMAVISVPGSIANGVLAGVNPIFGLYATIFGTAVGALFTSSVIMNVDTTGATALATGNTLADFSAAQHLEFLVVLVVLIGLFQLIFGLLKLGDLTDFISNAVMTGFISGVAVLAILGQVGDLTGYSSNAAHKIVRAIDTAFHFREIDLSTLAISLLTMAVIFGFERTRYRNFAYLIALVVSSVLVPLLGLDTVALVGDTVAIPQSLPQLHLPHLSLVWQMILPAFAIALIGLVQAAGVSQSIPNPDGDYPDPSGDFRGQGAANVAVGFFGGLPVGGSLSGTALLRSLGGRTRWANIFSGLFSLVVVLLFASLIGRLPIPAIAGIIVMASLSIINVRRIETAWKTGPSPIGIMLITFVGTLLMPIQYAVILGVILHILLFVFQSAETVRLEQIVSLDDGRYAETTPPAQIPDGEIIILQPVGSIFFAGAARLEDQLPAVGQAQRAVVILRLRDRDEVGSTFIRVIEHYARSLQANDCQLMLVGINERVKEQLEKTDLLDLLGPDNVFLAEARFGEAIEAAVAAAHEWLARDDG